MMLGQLTILKRQHSNGKPCLSWVVAAWHWRWSITWRWLITWSPGLSGSVGFYFLRVCRGQGFNFHCGANFPIVGSIAVQTQPNMRIGN